VLRCVACLMLSFRGELDLCAIFFCWHHRRRLSAAQPWKTRALEPQSHSSTNNTNNIMTSFTCRCGDVKIQLSSDSRRVTTECCCNHCFARMNYLASMGGPTIDKDRPLTCSKWDNRAKVLSGKISCLPTR